MFKLQNVWMNLFSILSLFSNPFLFRCQPGLLLDKSSVMKFSRQPIYFHYTIQEEHVIVKGLVFGYLSKDLAICIYSLISWISNALVSICASPHAFGRQQLCNISSITFYQQRTMGSSCSTKIPQWVQAMQFLQTQSRTVVLIWIAKLFQTQLGWQPKYLQFCNVA